MNQTIEYHRSVALANDGAMTFGSPHVCTEHLLLGLAAEGKGAAAKTLKSFGVGVKEISSELKKLIGIEVAYENIPFSIRAGSIFERSHKIALSMFDRHVGTKHMLIALIDDAIENSNEPRIALIMKNLKVDLNSIREKAVMEKDREKLPSGGRFIVPQKET
ncbi:MAG: hypothetical protein C0507_10830 [Cyanobacteria bacterium PR.3.49]|nr:hypothetical protein [Cyanobacteria bacterium PR.3.49]